MYKGFGVSGDCALAEKLKEKRTVKSKDENMRRCRKVAERGDMKPPKSKCGCKVHRRRR
jgi:hypothetical protein